jgi:hypothetical protein
LTAFPPHTTTTAKKNKKNFCLDKIIFYFLRNFYLNNLPISPGGRSGSNCLTMPEYKAASAAPQAGSTKTLTRNKQRLSPLFCLFRNDNNYKIAQAHMLMLPLLNLLH